MTRPTRSLLIAALVVALVAAGPLLSALLAESIVSSLGCALNEGSSNRCLPIDIDIGGALYTMFVMGWLMLLTVWLAPVALLLRRASAG